jgi:hypothetical protein
MATTESDKNRVDALLEEAKSIDLQYYAMRILSQAREWQP